MQSNLLFPCQERPLRPQKMHTQTTGRPIYCKAICFFHAGENRSGRKKCTPKQPDTPFIAKQSTFSMPGKTAPASRNPHPNSRTLRLLQSHLLFPCRRKPLRPQEMHTQTTGRPIYCKAICFFHAGKDRSGRKEKFSAINTRLCRPSHASGHRTIPYTGFRPP